MYNFEGAIRIELSKVILVILNTFIWNIHAQKMIENIMG